MSKIVRRNGFDWYNVLLKCQVKPSIAHVWALALAATIREDTFSAGEDDLRNFLAQALYETRKFECLEENLNYSAERIREIGRRSPKGSRWRSLVPRADELEAGTRQAFANAVYGGRLGNTGPNDGWLYRGSGIPMITGKANYEKVQALTGLPVVAHPELLRHPLEALKAGIAWWERDVSDEHLGSVADVTLDVQGGDLGLEAREVLTEKVTQALTA